MYRTSFKEEIDKKKRKAEKHKKIEFRYLKNHKHYDIIQRIGVSKINLCYFEYRGI